MSWFLFILATLSALLIWRDLKSGRVYDPTGEFGQFDYHAPEHFEEKEQSPIYYWTVISIAALCSLAAFVLGILLFFIPIKHLEIGESQISIDLVIIAILIVYLLNGSLGRVFSWVKNYGSIDKKW